MGRGEWGGESRLRFLGNSRVVYLNVARAVQGPTVTYFIVYTELEYWYLCIIYITLIFYSVCRINRAMKPLWQTIEIPEGLGTAE